MVKKILAIVLLTVLVCNIGFAFDIKEVLKANVGHTVRILFKNTEDVESWGRIVEVHEDYLVTKYENKIAYIRIDEIAIIIIEDDVTMKNK